MFDCGLLHLCLCLLLITVLRFDDESERILIYANNA